MNTFPAFRSIVWKELRYNWRWAVIGAFALAIDLVVQTFSSLRAEILENVWLDMDTVISLAAPLIAIAIGVMQVVPEQSRDRWAFFLHRPARPAMLLTGKIVSGVVLYLLATLVPFFGFLLWLSIPGHVAGPIDFTASVPELVDIAYGIPFYLATILCLVRKARWTKCLPMVPAFLGSLTLPLCTEYWQGFVIAATLTIVYALALWDAFGRPEGRQQSRTGRIAFGTVIVLAASLLLTLLVSSYLAFPTTIWPQIGQVSPTYEHVVLDSGDVLLSKYVNDRSVSATGVSAGVSTQTAASYLSGNLSWVRMEDVRQGKLNDRSKAFFYASHAFPVYIRQSSIWYLYNGHLVHYSTSTNRFLGELTLSGQSHNMSSSGPFSLGSGLIYFGIRHFLMNQGSLYAFDGKNSRFVKVLNSTQTDGLQILECAVMGPGKYSDDFIAVTNTNIYGMSEMGQINNRVPRLYPHSIYNDLSVGTGPDGDFFVQYANVLPHTTVSVGPTVLQQFSPQGTLVRSQLLPQLPKTINTLQSPVLTALVGATSPFPLSLDLFRDLDYQTRPSFPIFNALPIRGDINFTPSLNAFMLASLLAGFLSAILTIVIGRRAKQSWQSITGWALGALVLSWPILAAQILLTEFSVMAVCTSCGKRRSVSGVHCEHCGAEWSTEANGNTPSSGSKVEWTETTRRELAVRHSSGGKFGGFVKKELKATWRWAALGLVALIAGFFYEVYTKWGRANVEDIWQAVQFVMLFGSAILGLGLAIMQIYPEQSRDRWAFLVHRPVTRGALFLGKAVAGLLLYGAATSISLLFMIAWIASPGRFPYPFVWGLTESIWAEILIGTIFYFAGYLVMLRHVRWYGSRLLPVAAAIFWTANAVQMPTFWMSTAVFIPPTIVMVFCARNVFVMPAEGKASNGSLVSLGGMLFSGIFAICAVVLLVAGGITAPFPNNSVSKDYVVDAAGAISLTTQEKDQELSRTVIKPATLNTQYPGDLVFADLWSPDETSEQTSGRYSEPRTYVQQILPHPDMTHLDWYFVNHRIVSYSVVDHKEHGVLTPHGYVPGPMKNTPDEEYLIRALAGSPTDYSTVMPTQDTIYHVDLADRTTTPMLTGSAAASTVHIAQITNGGYGINTVMRTVILSGGLFHIFGGLGQPLGIIKPQRDHTFNSARVGVDSAGNLYFWYSTANSATNIRPTSSGVIVETDQYGHKVSTTNLAPLPAEIITPAFDTSTARIWFGLATGPLNNPDLIASVGGMSLDDKQNMVYRWAGNHWNDILVSEILAAIACAILSWFAARRAGLPISISVLWIVFCFALTWSALLLLLCLYPWPGRLICSSCGRKRFVEKSTCEYCKAGWPAASRTGTEIFEKDRSRDISIIG